MDILTSYWFQDIEIRIKLDFIYIQGQGVWLINCIIYIFNIKNEFHYNIIQLSGILLTFRWENYNVHNMVINLASARSPIFERNQIKSIKTELTFTVLWININIQLCTQPSIITMHVTL